MRKKEIKAFISYAHDDSVYFDVLLKGLNSHSSESINYKWEFWNDNNILVGNNWYNEIIKNINECDVAILMVTSNFFASKFIKAEEFSRFIIKAKEKNLVVFPILINYCDFKKWEDLSNIQFYRVNGKDFDLLKKEDIVYADLVVFDKDGVLIPNSNREKYHMKLIVELEKPISQIENDKEVMDKRYLEFPSMTSIKKKKKECTFEVVISTQEDIDPNNLPDHLKDSILSTVYNVLGRRPPKGGFYPGSIKYRLELTRKEAEKLFNAAENGKFSNIKVRKASIYDSKGMLLKSKSYNYTMSKSQLIDDIASRTDLTKINAKKALDAFIESTSDALKTGDRVALVGFGSFSVSEKKSRTGRNPRTEKEITIPVKKVISFKAGSDLSSIVQ
ncbi:MAG: HU family DNA-binding protein [Bacteroidales bacterium]|nr:HU family DNA-binding protein [Bacteroidales bacterium]